MIVIDGQRYLEVQEAAQQLGVKPATLYAYVSRGRLKSYRQGTRRRRLYLASDVAALITLLPGAGSADRAALMQPPNVGESDLPRADRWAMER